MRYDGWMRYGRNPVRYGDYDREYGRGYDREWGGFRRAAARDDRGDFGRRGHPGEDAWPEHGTAGRMARGGRPSGYGRDYWWLGEREMDPQGYGTRYDEAYRFGERIRPRYTPVGGMYPALGGDYLSHQPRQLREPTWFSDWTRWF